MKKLVVLLLITTFTGMVYAQTNLKTPLPNQQFIQKLNQTKENILNQVKYITQTNMCFAVLHINGISNLSDYGNSIFEIPKCANNYSVNKDKYYIKLEPSIQIVCYGKFCSYC